MSPFEKGVQEATQYVLHRGAVDNKEHLVALDASGNFIHCQDGSDHEVNMETYDFSNTVAVVHNHPNNAALSVQDVLLATGQNITTYAVTPSGSVHKTRGLVAGKVDAVAIKALFVEKTLSQVVFMEYMFSDMGKEEGETIASNLVMMFLKETGLIDYEAQLSAQDKALIFQHNGYKAIQSFKERLASM